MPFIYTGGAEGSVRRQGAAARAAATVAAAAAAPTLASTAEHSVMEEAAAVPMAPEPGPAMSAAAAAEMSALRAAYPFEEGRHIVLLYTSKTFLFYKSH